MANPPRFSVTISRSTSQDPTNGGSYYIETRSPSPSFTIETSGGPAGSTLPQMQFHSRFAQFRDSVINDHSPTPPPSGSATLFSSPSTTFGSTRLQQQTSSQPEYYSPARSFLSSGATMPQAATSPSASDTASSSSGYGSNSTNSFFQHQSPLANRLSMPFRSAFSRGFRSDLLKLDNFDNFFRDFDQPGFGFDNGRSPFSNSFDDDDGDDLFAALDRGPPTTVFRRDSDPMLSTHGFVSQQRTGNRDMPSVVSMPQQGELADTVHHIIHSEDPNQLQQRVKIFIAQDRARSLDSNNNNRQQHFPRISARLPHGGSLSFSFSTSSTTMHINDGIESGQVPPHPLLTIEQKKQLKERLLAQKNDFISGPNTSATILSSEHASDLSAAKPGGQNTTGSVAERVMWFEGVPQLTAQPPGRTHRSAAHIALQNWKLANADMMDYARPKSVERVIPIIREGEAPKPNSNAIHITLEVPPKQSARVTPVGDALAPSKPGNHALSSVVITPQIPQLTELPQKSDSQKGSAKVTERKHTEHIIPTILPSPEPKPVAKKWLKEPVKEPVKPAAETTEISPLKTPSRAELDKASQNIMRALQNGMKQEKIKEDIVPKPAVSVEIPVKQKTPSPPKIPAPSSPTKTLLAVDIPQFHYPRGRPGKDDSDYGLMEKVRKSFNGKTELKLEDMKDLMKSLGLPFYWRRPILLATVGPESSRDSLTFEMVWNTWKRITTNCYDDASRFVCLLAKPGCDFLVPNDFMPLIQDVVDNHPGLNILKEAPEFHARYVNTVIARIFFCVNRSWSGNITIEELRRSNFLPVLATLELEDDINVITEYFSYEHFYVIYCKFWELDRDHDLLIDKTDLARHNDHAISSKMIDRIFSGAVTRGPTQKEGKMSYSEFVWFLISEEDKRHPRSIEYWFRCMDVDGDGVLSLFELEYFYEEQLQRMKSLGIEALPFEDIACQMLDMVHPKHKDRILLTDLKRCRMTPLFFDTFFNIEKYLLHEHRDPFASAKVDTEDNEPISDWDRYAAEEYELLVSEDAATEDL